MSDRRVGGDTNKWTPDELKREQKVDADEFSRMMKERVQEGEESQKKRKRPEIADTEAEEEATQEAEKPTAGAFSSFMEEGGSSILDLETPQAESSIYREEPTEMIDQNAFENLDTSTLDENATELNRPVESSPVQHTDPHKEKEKAKAKPADTSFFGEKKAEGPHDKVKKPHVLKNKDPNKPGGVNEAKGISNAAQKAKGKSAGPNAAKQADAVATRAKAKQSAATARGERESSGVEESEGLSEKKEMHAKGDVAAQEEAPLGAAAPMQGGPMAVQGSAAAAAKAMGPTAALKPEILHILQKASLTIKVMKELGLEKTSVELHMPNSVFNGATIELSKYAENDFNLQLLGTPEAVAHFEGNRASLEKAFKEQGLTVRMQASGLKEMERKKRVHRKQPS